MKTLVFGSVVVVVAVLGFLYLTRSRGNFNEPRHRVTMKDGSFEVREYDGYAVAEMTLSGSFDRATSQSFRPLFGYISGENRGRADIKMTSPVLVEPTSEKMAMTVPVLVEPDNPEEHGLQTLDEDEVDAWTVAFVLPEPYTADSAPVPQNSHVTIRDVAAHTAASIRFNGRFTSQGAETNRRQLEEWLAEQGLEHLGDWRVAAYDAPMTLPWLRRNEVLVTLP